MTYLTIIILVFSLIASLDRMFGSKLGLGKEFDKAFMLLGVMSLSMIGMIIISPAIANLMKPVSLFFADVFHIDPSIIPASLFANDMGGAPLCREMALDESIGLYNGLVISSMMGCTISFTIPFALGVVDKKQHNELMLGILCGLVTIPVGSIVSGVVCGLPFADLIVNLIPIVLFSAVIAFGLLRFPLFCIKAFKAFGFFITAIITLGLALGIVEFLTGHKVIEGLATMEDGIMICINSAIVLSGTFPLVFVVAKLLKKPLRCIGNKIGVNEFSIVGIISSLTSSATAFGTMDKMDKKGAVLNSAFSVSGAFILGSHLAFTMAFDSALVAPVIVGKVVSAISALVLANYIFGRNK